MSGHNSFVYHYEGVTYNVAFRCGGFGDECEIDELEVTTADNIVDLLPAKVLNHIEQACFEHLPEGPEFDDDAREDR